MACGAFLVPAPRRHASLGRRGAPADGALTLVSAEVASDRAGQNANLPAVSHRHHRPAMITHAPRFALPVAVTLPGERFVALSALCVLAIATVFFAERIGNLPAMRDAPVVAPLTAPALDRSNALLADATLARFPPSSEAEPTVPANEARTRAPVRTRPSVATVRKPDGKAEARTRLSGSVGSTAAYAMPNPPPAPHYVRTRWDLLREEVGWCAQRSSLFDALLCEQRARLRWCEEWWGRASECPSGRQGDYAN